jgi:protein-S-isoprenylcysteine O-methyltransferase Ste14
MKKRLKINGIIMFFAFGAICLLPGVFLRKSHCASVEVLVEVCGLAFILLGQLFRASARGYKSEYSHRGEALIRNGPYAFVRNPMYLGILLIGLGIVLMLFNWWVASVFLLVFAARYILLTLSEEKKLLALFPEEYAEYKRTVPRLFPSVRILIQRDIGEYLPVKFIWIKRELNTILAVLVVTLLVKSWKDISSQGLAAYLYEALILVSVILLFAGLIVYLNKRTSILEKDGSYKSENTKK